MKRWQAQLMGDWQLIAALFVLAIVGHIVLWIAYPPHFGPDGAAYTGLYVDAFEMDVPIGYTNLVHRMPLAPILQTLPLSQGVTAYEIVHTLLAASSVIMVFLIVQPWGKVTAFLTALLYLACIPVQLQFHQVSVDSVFLWTILLVCVGLRYALQNMTYQAWGCLGLAIGLCAMVRPNGLMFLGFAVCMLLSQNSWRRRFQQVALMGVVTLIVIMPWMVYRGVRYDSWTFSRGGWFLFYTAFTNSSLKEGIVKPENGPATQELADLVSEHLLTHPNYTTYNITLDDFFRYRPEGRNFRFYQDAVALSDYYVGYDTNYRLLNEVAREAIDAHPDIYWQTIRSSISTSLFQALFMPHIPAYTAPEPVAITAATGNYQTPPVPSEGEMIASSVWSMWDTRPPDQRDPTEAEQQQQAERMAEIHAPLFTANGDQEVGDLIIRIWNRVWVLKPQVLYGLTGIALLLNRRKSLLFLILINGSALATVLISAVLAPYIRYRMAVEPIFILSAAIGVKSMIDTFRTRKFQDYFTPQLPETENAIPTNP